MTSLGINVKMTLGFGQRGGGGSASFPLSLFAAGEDGAWYDPSDLSTLSQTSGGTLGNVSVGDPVGQMNDKSGNGHHATQATAAARMTVTGSDPYYLAPDGVDDNFVVPLGSNFTGDFCLILDTGPIFGSIDTKSDGQWQYTKNPAYIPDGNIHALIVVDRAFTQTEKDALAAYYDYAVTTRPTTAENAFRDRTDLTALDASYGDWTQVASVVAAFRGCSGLTTPPDVSGWTQVTDAQATFRGCLGLTTTPDVSNWTQVTNARAAFLGCTGLTTPPDVSGWTQVTDAGFAFRGCTGFTTPPDVSGWAQVTNAREAFLGCTGLTSAINLDNWNPTMLTNAFDMMNGISAAGFDQAAYDSALIAWDAAYDLTTVNTIDIHFGAAQYTTGGAAETARNTLAANGWTITDGGPA